MDLKEYLDFTAKQVDVMIDRFFGSEFEELGKASAHILMAGGKRLRPAVVMLAADAVRKGSSDEVMHAALALELTHCFTLIHDDIMDGDSFRRGVPTVHTKWDEPTAILAGDVLYARSFDFICKSLSPDQAKVRAVSMLAEACVDICRGQHMDMSFEKREDVTEGEYLEMVSKKTGALYAAAAGIGSILAGGQAVRTHALYHYGMYTGMAFQIQDDVIDIMASAEKSGKDRASDIREGKQTLITIRAREKGLDLSPYRRDLTDREIEEVITLLNGAGVIDGVKDTARELVSRGKQIISILPDSAEKQLLNELGDYFVTRGY
jgi:geranylgeranyl diphosphate synthase, type I